MKQIKKLIFIIGLIGSSLTFRAQDWNQSLKIVASNRDEGDIYGGSVSISGDYAAVGAQREDGDNDNSQVQAGAVYILKYNNGTWNEVQKISASDMGIGDGFGRTVAISGDYLIIGVSADDDDENGSNELSGAGSAYIFHNNGEKWEQMQKIVASDREENDEFGTSVSINEHYAVVGAGREDHDSNGNNFIDKAGSAYIFYNNNGTWQQAQKITPSDRQTNDRFGYSVFISENYLFAGAPFDDHNTTNQIDAGSVYVFTNNNGTWEEYQKITASDKDLGADFGCSISVSGDNAIIGAYRRGCGLWGNSPWEAGAAYFFNNNNGTWEETQMVTASDWGEGDYFGASVSVSSDFAIVGAYQEDEDSQGNNTIENAGSAYIFQNINGNWQQIEKITTSNRTASDRFGESVSISDPYIIIGCRGDDEDENEDNILNDAGSAYFFTYHPALNSSPSDKFNCCVGSEVLFSIEGININEYLWHFKKPEDTYWTQLTEDDVYSGTNSPTLHIIVNGQMENYQFMCIIKNQYSKFPSSTAYLSADSENPILTTCSNQNISIPVAMSYYLVTGNEFNPAVEDNCSVFSLTNDYNNSETLEGAMFLTGNTKVTWTATDEAGNSASCSFDVNISKTTSISALKEAGILIYPNPVNNFIEIKGIKNNILKIKLTDLQGKTVYEKTEIPQNGIFDVSTVNRGIYVLTIQTDHGFVSEKIVKD